MLRRPPAGATPARRGRHTIAGLAIASLLTLALGACAGAGGGGGVASLSGDGQATTTTVAGKKDFQQARLEWAECMRKNGVDANSVAVIGIGLDATAVAAQEQGMVEAAVMLDPAVTLLQGKYKETKILSDTRTQHDTLEVFGGEYPGGSLYTRADWIAKNPKETQALTIAILATLKWIQTHSPEEIMAKMPPDMVGADKELYLAALKNTIPMYSTTGRMDPKGADAVLAVFSQSVPEIAKANIDLSKTYTNKFVEQVPFADDRRMRPDERK